MTQPSLDALILYSNELSILYLLVLVCDSTNLINKFLVYIMYSGDVGHTKNLFEKKRYNLYIQRIDKDADNLQIK